MGLTSAWQAIKSAKVVSKIEIVSDVLLPLHLQALHCSCYYGLNSLLHHWDRHVHPADIRSAELVDGAIPRVARPLPW